MTATLTIQEIEQYKSFADRLADAAAVITLANFRRPIEIENKETAGAFDPVTAADKAAEQAMRALITEEYPEHTIIGEEYDSVQGSSKFSWVLDPIDGTRAYIMGLPTWGTLIALLYEGDPIIGIIDQPYTKERFVGTPHGTSLNGKDITCRTCDTLGDAILSTTAFESFSASEQKAYLSLASTVKLNRPGYDCYAYAMVAHGMIDIVAEAAMKIVDIMALIPIIRGAGGIVSNWHGKDVCEDGRLLACGDANIHRAAVELLKDV